MTSNDLANPETVQQGLPERAPRLSIVIASGASGPFLPRCLDSLRAQVDRADVEVIVVDRCGGQVAERIATDYDFVQLERAAADRRPSIPELRAMGVERARGDIVAVIEEHCTAPGHWVERIISSFRPEDAAIGGPILDAGYSRLRDWVVYFSEYHNYLPPWPDGERYQLNGANVAYDRRKLVKHRELLTQGYWEVVLHPSLSREGRFRAVSDLGVHHTGPFHYGYYLRQRYLLSRVWGGTRRNKVSGLKRLAYLIAAPVLPILLLARIVSKVARKPRLRVPLLKGLPLLVPVVLAYVWGEWLGYLRGVGDALEHVE